MLLHSALICNSLENAKLVFETVFKLPFLYGFEVDSGTMQQLFHLQVSARIRVYDCGNSRLEVFIPTPSVCIEPSIHHVCLEVTDSSNTIRTAEKHGLQIRRSFRESREIIFISDRDGNLYEIKEASLHSSPDAIRQTDASKRDERTD